MKEQEKIELIELLLEVLEGTLDSEGVTFLYDEEKEKRLFELKERWEANR